jgi:hypothetical protein
MDERFARADELTDRAFSAALAGRIDVEETLTNLAEVAEGDRPAIAIARARLAAHLAHRSTAAIARMAVALLDNTDELVGDRWSALV